MTFRIQRDESVGEGVRRIACEQIDKAIVEIEDDDLDRHETVHQVRKHCKKLRGLVRFVRPQFEDTYSRENAWYRDSARMLSCVRDAQGIIETYDGLVEHFAHALDEEVFARVRELLTQRRQEVADDEVGLDRRLEEFLVRMREGRERVDGWRLQDDGFDAVAGGVLKTYRRGRKAMSKALDEPSVTNFHEWRKRSKYHWYHAKLLRDAWEEPIDALQGEVHRLSDFLGDDHDLAILGETLLVHANRVQEETLQALSGLIAQRQAQLRADAARLGRRLFAEKPGRLGDRLRRYWEADGGEPALSPDVHTVRV